MCLLCWSKVSEIWDWVVAAEGQKGNERERGRQTDRQTERQRQRFLSLELKDRGC